MSEYQTVMFRAVDRPLTDKQLQFVDRQSSRAEFTKWDYHVEYNYGSFRGDVDGMLKQGYDVYLSYSNFGEREIRMRLPHGLPFPKSTWKRYLNNESMKWKADKTGTAGILSISPCLGETENLWEFDGYLEATIALRTMLISGDLRALYVLWLCGVWDENQDGDDLSEPPVPHGMAKIPEGARDLLWFFEVDPMLIDAAATGNTALTLKTPKDDPTVSWLSTLEDSRKTAIIERLLTNDPFVLKSDLLSEIRDNQLATEQTTEWPTDQPRRTIADLLKQAEILRTKEDEKEKRKAAAKAKREATTAEKMRQDRMKKMQAAPQPWLAKASELVEQRGTDNYREAANILADLREAIGGTDGERISRTHAAHLMKKYPTLTILKSSFKKCKLLE